MKILRYVLMGVVILIAGVQLVRPARTNPPASNPYPIGDVRVESILRRACFDCHSNETKWPWYSEFAPMSWQIAVHVKDGRRHVNFSDWNPEKAAKRVDEICEEVKHGEMPIKGYLLLHPKAKLTSDDKKALCEWSVSRLAATTHSEKEKHHAN